MSEIVRNDKFLLQKSRIDFPFVWNRNGTGIKVQDLTKDYYDAVIKMIKFYYLQEEVLCRNTVMEEDLTSVRCLTKSIRLDMEQGISVIAIDEVEDKLAGALILSLQTDTEDCQELPVEGRALSICTDLINFLLRSCNVFRHFNCNRYVNLTHLCIKPEYRSKGISYLLMRGAVQVARAINAEVIAGVFSSSAEQSVANEIGMQVIEQVKFENWRDEKDRMWFSSPGEQNPTCALMGCRIPDELPKEPIPLPIPAGKSASSTKSKKKK